MNLDELKQTRHTLQVAEAAAAQAVHHAQKKVSDALFDVCECERELDAARDRAALDKAQAALDSARKDHALAVKRLTDKKGEHAHADMQAHAAAAAVVRAVDQILMDEITADAKSVAHHLDEARRQGIKLRHFTLAAGIHTAGIISAATQQILDRLSLPLIDMKEIPINLEQLGDVPAFQEWLARRERMIADEVQEATVARSWPKADRHSAGSEVPAQANAHGGAVPGQFHRVGDYVRSWANGRR
jgi:hypothetical protein